MGRSERAAHSPALHEKVGAKARQAAHPKRKVQLAFLLEVQFLGVSQHRIAKLLGVHRGERIDPQGNQHTVDAKLRRRAGGDVQVGGALLHHGLEQLLQVDGKPTSLRGRRLIGLVSNGHPLVTGGDAGDLVYRGDAFADLAHA